MFRLVLSLCLALAACLPADAQPRARAMARLAGLDGKPMGTASFRSVNGGVLIELDLHGLPPGPHGMHLHASAQCDAKSGFMKAGPILSLNSRKRHGYLAKGGPLTGDLPNQFAGADGRLKASTVTHAFTLGHGKRSSFHRDGVSLIVKKRGDDYRTQPIGNSGDRIACGTVVRTQGTAPRRFPAKPAQNARP